MQKGNLWFVRILLIIMMFLVACNQQQSTDSTAQNQTQQELDMANVFVVDGVQLLEQLEDIQKQSGVSAVADFIAEQFSIGTLVDLQQGDGKIYQICNHGVWQTDSSGNIMDFAYLEPLGNDNDECRLIRVLALSYLSEPFHAELYGTVVR